MTTYDLEILIRTKKTGDGLEQLEAGTARVTQGLKQTSATTEVSGLRFTELASKLSVAKVAFNAVAGVAKVAYDQIERGAELQAARTRFDNLSKSINTTSDALLGRLTEATRGMVSNSELITSATDIINLGLAKDEEGVTRLATVVGALGLKMEQVTLTFANNSKARLDSLGLSVEEVTKKAAELEAQGFQGDAFDEAVLLGLEDKMSLYGDAIETTSGQLAVLKAELLNAKDASAEFLATITAPVIENLAKSTSGYQQELHKTALELAATAKNSSELRQLINEQFGEGEDLFKQAEDLGLAFVDLGNGQSVWIDDLEKAAGLTLPQYSQQLERLNQLSLDYDYNQAAAIATASSYDAALLQNYAHLQEVANAERELEEATRARAFALVESFQDAATPVSELLSAQDALTQGQLSGVYQSDAAAAEAAQARIDAANEAIKQSYRETAAEAILAQQGVTEETLDLLVGIGYLTQEQAGARLEFANTTTEIEKLTASFKDTTLTAGEQTAALNALISGEASTAEEAVNLAKQQTAVNDALNAMPKAVGSTVTIRGLDESGTRLGDLLRQMNNLDGRHVSANVTVRTDTELPDFSQGGGKGDVDKTAAGKQLGGPFSPDRLYRVGEGGLPEIGMLRSSGKLFMIPGEGGQVFSNSQAKQMLGGYTDNSQINIVNNNLEAAATTNALVQERRRARLDAYMGAN